MEQEYFFLDYEQARRHLICRLVPPQNRALLRKVPFARAAGELMAVPCIYRYEEDGKLSGTPVTLFGAAQWEIAPGQLLQDAVSNM